MNNKKELERAELHSTIWKIANDLRGSVDGWDFKQYVLGLLFYRFISENLTNYINEGEHKAGNKDFDYSTLSDEEAEFGRMETLEEKGFDLYHIWRPTENRSGQVAYKKDGCKIDLMFKRFSDENQRAGRAWWCVYMGGKAIYKSVPLEYYAELKDIKLHDLIFDAPKNIEGYLKYRYGDWRKKVNRKDYSCYTSDKSIVNDYEKI